MSNIIKAVFTGRFCTTRRIWRWDTDDKLQFVNLDLPQNYTVDFANSLTGDSVPVLATSDTVQIPPDLFVPGSEIYAWVWVSDTNGGHTKCQATIPIDPRAQRSGTSPTPAQASAWDEAVDTLNETVEGIPTAIDTALAEAKDSGEFDGAPGADGAPGTKIWWTESQVSTQGGVLKTPRRQMSGQNGTPAVGDYVFGPEADAGSGDPTDLYIITASATLCTVTHVGRVKGTDGTNGTDGKDGKDGQDGTNGTDGATFTPSVSSAGVLSWANDGGKQNPESVDLVAAVLNALPTWDGGSY